MAQYKTGSVSVTNGSQTVTGLGTLWSSEVSSGDIFTVVGENAWYEVGSVDSDTQITLSANYAGINASGAAYAITRDFTTNYGWPYPQKGDIETASLIKRAFEDIDAKLVLTNTDGDVTVAGDITLSAGTANGVAYLNGSKVLTSGSALTFDGTNLTLGANTFVVKNVVGDLSGLKIYQAASDVSTIMNNYNGSMVFGTNNTERMRLTSTGLGIGTSSPPYALSVVKNTTGAHAVDVLNSTTGAGSSRLILRNASDTNGSGFQIINNAQDGNVNLLNYKNTDLAFWTNSTERLRIDSSGNLGLGVTPSAWETVAFDLQDRTGIWETSNGTSIWANNTYYDGGFKYKKTGLSAYYSQRNTGGHAWFTAPSGTAGNAISFTQAMTLDASGRLLVGATSGTDYLTVSGAANEKSTLSLVNTGGGGSYRVISNTGGNLAISYNGTERARIDSSGNLLVGTTDAAVGVGNTNTGTSIGSVGYQSISRTGTSAQATLYLNKNTNDGTIVNFSKSGTGVGSISVTGSATAYNTSSDYRLKDNIQDITGSGAFIDALQPRTWNWKVDGSAGAGFIAHELQAVSPSSVVGEKDAVDADGNPEYQAVEYGSAEVIAMLVAEVKSLRARLTAAGL